jgi:hypothetical protein
MTPGRKSRKETGAMQSCLAGSPEAGSAYLSEDL